MVVSIGHTRIVRAVQSLALEFLHERLWQKNEMAVVVVVVVVVAVVGSIGQKEKVEAVKGGVTTAHAYQQQSSWKQ